MSWKPEKAAHFKKKKKRGWVENLKGRLNQLKSGRVENPKGRFNLKKNDQLEMGWNLKWQFSLESWNGRFERESWEGSQKNPADTQFLFTRREEDGGLGIFRKTKDISQRLDWMTLWKFSACDCQHVYCGIPLIPL